MGNLFAYFAILVWPIVALILFRVLSRPAAVIWTLMAGYVLLPARTTIDLPLFPGFSKDTMPTYAAFALAILGVSQAGRRLAGAIPQSTAPAPWLPTSTLSRTLVFLGIIGTMVTAFTNSDPIRVGERILPALTLHDSVNILIDRTIFLLPLFLGYRYLSFPGSHRLLLRAFVLTGLALSLPALLEVMIYPQLHTWIYGHFPHSHAQVRRFGGYRPMVFMQHGLLLAILFAMSALAAAAMLRVVKDTRWMYGLATMWLTIVLVLAKSLGAIGMAFMLLPVVLFLSKRTQMTVAIILAMLVLSYPLLRISGTLSEPVIRTIILPIVPADRYASLRSRLDQEDQLAAHAMERPIFGWGTWGRNRVYDEQGRDISVTDGSWVIVLGIHGIVGYAGTFGLLCAPVFLIYLRKREPPPPETVGLCLVLSLNLLDMLPNSSLNAMSMLTAGALLGFAENERTIIDARPDAHSRPTGRRLVPVLGGSIQGAAPRRHATYNTYPR